MAAVITARLCTYVKDAIDCPISRVVCWTDNSSTLHWIRGSATQWKPFVANRVIEIQSLFGSQRFGAIVQDCTIKRTYLHEVYL